jgi:hypothetical protein
VAFFPPVWFNCHSSEASPKLCCVYPFHEDQSQSHQNLIKIFVALAWDRIPQYFHHVKSVFFLLNSYSSKVAFQGVMQDLSECKCAMFFLYTTICSINNSGNNNNNPSTLPTHKFLI